MHDGAVGAVYGAALLHFFDESLREAIAGAEFHVAEDRLGRWSAEIVILEIAVSVLVNQIPSLGARRFRDENAGERQAGGVILHELHVFQWGTRLKSQRHAI